MSNKHVKLTTKLLKLTIKILHVDYSYQRELWWKKVGKTQEINRQEIPSGSGHTGDQPSGTPGYLSLKSW